RLVPQPVRDRVVNDADAREPGDRRAEAFAPVAGGRRAGQALDLDDGPLAVQDLRDVLAGGAADLAVVGADKGGIALALDRPVEHDDRVALPEDLLDDR